jgi:hypothetical protein
MASEDQEMDSGTEKVMVAKDDAGPPAWELRYDDPDKTTILHQHGTAGVPTTFTDRGDGVWVAQCTECEDSLEIRGTSGPHGDGRGADAAG